MVNGQVTAGHLERNAEIRGDVPKIRMTLGRKKRRSAEEKGKEGAEKSRNKVKKVYLPRLAALPRAQVLDVLQHCRRTMDDVREVLKKEKGGPDSPSYQYWLGMRAGILQAYNKVAKVFGGNL